jgi:serine O-acetyltransferase
MTEPTLSAASPHAPQERSELAAGRSFLPRQGGAFDAIEPHGSCPETDRPASMQVIVRLHGWSRRLLERRWHRLSRMIDCMIRLGYAARIPAEAYIDPTVHFSHNALAVVVTKEAWIGPRSQIGVHVLLGSRWPTPGGPRIEEDVIIHAGAKIIGPITVGRGSVIGAGAVVVEDVPPHSLVVGVPGVVKKTGIRIKNYLQPGAADSDVE